MLASSRYCSAKECVVFEGWVCETAKQEKHGSVAGRDRLTAN